MFSERVWNACRRIPEGKVTTYSEIARYLGMNNPRAVGQALKRNPFPGAGPEDVPCHRVVMSDGSLGGYGGSSEHGMRKKAALLEREGVKVREGKISLEMFFCTL